VGRGAACWERTIDNDRTVSLIDLDDAEEWWRKAFSANPRLSPQQSFEWVRTWSRYFAPGSCRVYALSQGSELCAVLPVVSDGRKPPLPGSAPPDINDSFDVITHDVQQNPEMAAMAIAAVLEERRGRPLYLQSVAPDLLATLQRVDARCKCLVIGWETNPRLVLPSSWEEYVERLGVNQRADLRRNTRRAAEGDMSFRFLAESDAVAESTRLGLAQRRRVWSEHGLFEKIPLAQREPIWDEFLIEAARSLAASGLALSGELVSDHEVVGSMLVLQRQDHFLGYCRSSERSVMGFGAIFDALFLRAAIDRGVHVMDYGRGGERYKYRLGAVDTALCDVVIGHARPITLFTIAARATPHLARRLVRHRTSVTPKQ
jgi:CelD/BcsL family acetyltransferase involved in cellulose biosynthesis